MLEAYFEAPGRGEVFNAPINVILTEQDILQPDLVLVTTPEQVSKRGIEGAPLLLVKVLSPSTRDYDRTSKAHPYATLGVPHYWLVDPEAHTIECYRGREGQYELIVQAQGTAELHHPTWPDLQLSIADLWVKTAVHPTSDS